MWVGRHHEDSPRPAESIWDALSAVHSGSLEVAGHEGYVADGPLGQGAVLRAVHGGHRGPEMTVVEFQPGARYAHEFPIRRYRVRLGYTIEPLPAGSRLVRTIEVNGPIADLATASLGQQLLAFYKPQVRVLLDAIKQ